MLLLVAYVKLQSPRHGPNRHKSNLNITMLIQVWLMMFNATFNNISVIPWRSVLLVEETGVPRENHRPAASH
jgi:hypothetical protein